MGIDEADRDAFGVDDDDIVDVVVVEGGEDLDGEFFGLDGDGFGGEVGADGVFGDGGVFLEGADEVTMGEDAGEFTGWGGGDGDAGAGAGHGLEGDADGGFWGDQGELMVFAHDVADAGEEGAAEAAAWMEGGEVFAAEAAGFEEDHGEGVAEHEHGGGAGGGGEIERAGLAFDVDVEGDVGVAGEHGVGIAGEGDEGDLAAFEVGKEGQKFGCFAAGAEGEDEVAFGDDAEVAVEGVTDVEEDGGGTGAVEGGGEFAGDVTAFADTADDEFFARGEGVEHVVEGGTEVVADAILEALEFSDLEFDDELRFFGIIHVTEGGRTAEWGSPVREVPYERTG